MIHYKAPALRRR